MRKAIQDYGFLNYNDKFIGVSLGYDFCAEHEWGIKELKKIFGIPNKLTKKNLGIKSRMITKIPESLKFKKDGYDGAVLWIAYHSLIDNGYQDELPMTLENYKKNIKWEIDWDKKRRKKWKEKYNEEYYREPKDSMISAWDSKSFGIAVYGKEEVKWLEKLYKEIKKKNIAITPLNISGNNPFANASLSIIIVDTLPQSIIDVMYNVDKKQFDLIKYEKKIGMKKIIEKNKYVEYKKENYFTACTPYWINYENKRKRKLEKKERGTKYNIIYWINYSDDDNNSGWYTVEEIKKWFTTKGLKLTDIRKG
jgi:hypothetical protein